MTVFSIEQQALERMDIPLFTTRVDSEALNIDFHQSIDKYFVAPSFDLVISRLNQLDESDLGQQVVFIQGSLYSRIASETYNSQNVQNRTPYLRTLTPLNREEIVQKAIALASDIQKTAIRPTDSSATWITPQYISKAQRFQLQPMNHGLYDGGCGVALFLAALEKVTGGAGFRDLALAALQPLRQDLHGSVFERISQEIGIGGAEGCGSLIYGLVRSSQFLESATLLEDARKIASYITTKLIYLARSWIKIFAP